MQLSESPETVHPEDASLTDEAFGEPISKSSQVTVEALRMVSVTV